MPTFKWTFGNRNRAALCIALASVFAWAAPLPRAHAQGCVNATGETRAAILDVVREPVAADLRTKVEFKVERARVCGAWSFVLATPQLPGGGQIRWSGTPCQGDTSHLVGALLRGKAGGWELVDYALCPSDVAWADWPEKYGAPAAIFEE
ncbi:MAG: hypothetical protein U1E30_09065 [Rhodoblastus sp.]